MCSSHFSGPQEMQETKKGVQVNTPYDMKQLRRDQAMEAFMLCYLCCHHLFFAMPWFYVIRLLGCS